MTSIYVVYGWPRSGTSMMMEALIAGGMDAITAGPPYFEHNDLSDPENYVGKLLKPVRTDCARWPEWPDGYRVVFMRRDPQEQNASRVSKFGRHEERDIAYIIEANRRRMAVLSNRSDCEFIELWYNDVLADPLTAFRHIEELFNISLDIEKAVAIIDPKKRHFGG